MAAVKKGWGFITCWIVSIDSHDNGYQFFLFFDVISLFILRGSHAPIISQHLCHR